MMPTHAPLKNAEPPGGLSRRAMVQVSTAMAAAPLVGCAVPSGSMSARAGMPSHITPDLQGAAALTDDEIRERMSGNICRCSAYPNIVAAIRDVAGAVA